MEDIINKVCGKLITNPHIIGIILNCDYCGDITESKTADKVDLYIISKEAGNQKLLYTENGFTVCLRWRTDIEFSKIVMENPPKDYAKKILYDRTGFIKNQFENIIMR